MIGKWLESRRLKNECHKLNSEYHEVHRIDELPYRHYRERVHSAVMLINGYGKRIVRVLSAYDQDDIVKRQSVWYHMYGKPWMENVSNVIDDKDTRLENYNTFYIQNGTIFRKTIKPINGNAHVVDGDI